MSVRRYDGAAPITNIVRTPTGGLRLSANASRVGVFGYTHEDGTRTFEYRPPEEVLHPDSVASMIGVPFTDQHPPGMVSPTNYRDVTRGHVLSATPEVDHIETSIDVNDAEVMQRILSKEIGDLSPGYNADFDPTPGVLADGTKYDGVQRTIRYNHVAGLRPGEGRQGPTVSLRLDKGDAIASTLRCDSNEDRIPIIMIKVKVAGKTYDAGSQEHLDAVDSEFARLSKEAADASARASTEKERADKATDPKVVAGMIANRVALVTRARAEMVRAAKRDHAKDPKAFAVAHVKATKYLDAAEEMAATDDDTILRAILAASCPGLDTKGMSHEMLLGALSVSAMSGAAAPAPELDAEEEKIEAPLDAVTEPMAIPGLDSVNSLRPKLGQKNDKHDPDNATIAQQSQADALAELRKRREDAWKVGKVGERKR